MSDKMKLILTMFVQTMSVLIILILMGTKFSDSSEDKETSTEVNESVSATVEEEE